MPFSPCCKRKYSKPCKCSTVAQCNNCECIVQTGQCPPPPSTTEEEEESVLYSPVIVAAPASKKICTCCDVKPKKSLWQQLFGDRKCCPPCQKKKQECFCKQKRKQRCVPDCTNSLCYSDRKTRPIPTCKPCRPSCCCKVKTCNCKTRCKPCCPTPKSICGCHFYCNVENRPKLVRCRCCSPTRKNTSTDQRKTSSTDQRKTSIEPTTEEEKTIKNFGYKSSVSSNLVPIPERLVQEKSLSLLAQRPAEIKDRNRKTIDEPTRSNIHIGLTFTNTETKYYQKNNVHCPPAEKESSFNYTESEEPNESSEKIITLEIHHSDEKMDQDKDDTEGNGQDRDEEPSSINYSSKHPRLSILHEDNESHKPRSESYAREILPLLERRSRHSLGSETKPMNEISNDSVLRRKRERGFSNDHFTRPQSKDLDRRVSEILNRLKTIENKITIIETNRTENKNFNIDFDNRKSTVAVHFKNEEHENLHKKNYGNNNGGKHSGKADAVIEIRQTRSKSWSPVQKYSSSESSRHSRSLDRSTRVKCENPKLVIKLPNGNKISNGVVSVCHSNRVRQLSKGYHDSEWAEVSKQLKNRQLANTPCYCYECVCKRIKCTR